MKFKVGDVLKTSSGNIIEILDFIDDEVIYVFHHHSYTYIDMDVGPHITYKSHIVAECRLLSKLEQVLK